MTFRKIPHPSGSFQSTLAAFSAFSVMLFAVFVHHALLDLRQG
jgi:hypothetical protein